jgi:hypothetical protein
VIRRAAFLLVLFALAACGAPKPPAAKAPKAPAKPAATTTDDGTIPVSAPILDIDGDNLLNLAYGASVVSRTAELNLESSALNAIDGMSLTAWTTPPGAPEQTLVFGLGGPSRIDALGVTTIGGDRAPQKVRFEASSNGSSWREIATLEPVSRNTKLVDVKPFEARYLRVTTIEPAETYATLASIHANGREVRPAERFSFDGCWTINTRPARLVQRGARITGAVGVDRLTFVDGGMDGRVAKLMWMRGPMWGYVTATVTPDGRGLSAMTFHEEPVNGRAAEAWFGNRCDATPNAMPALPAPIAYLRRIGHWTMSGVVFDADEHLIDEPSRPVLDDAAALIRAMPSQRLRIIAHEFHHNDPKENRRRTEARIDAIRTALQARGLDLSHVRFVANGSERKDVEAPSAIQRMLWSRIDLELVKNH